MYPVSNNYKTAIASRVVTSNWYGTITTTSGTVISFDRTVLDQNQSKLTRQYANGDTLEIGTAYSSQLSIGLRGDYTKYIFYGAEIALYFRLQLTSSTYEDVPCGTFTVADAEFKYNSVKLTAYDYMQKFSGKVSGLSDAEPYAGLLAICTACGVTLGNTQGEIEAMTNGTVELAFSELEESETYRNVVGYVAAILCANAVIGRDNKLYIKKYSNTAVRTLGVSDRYNSSYIDYIGRYNRIALTDADGNEETYTATGTYTETLLTLNIGTNPLLNANEDSDDMAQAIVDDIVIIVYAPCTITTTQDPSLDIGDTLTISGGNITTPVNIIITKQDIKLYGQTQIVSAGGNYELTEQRTKTEYAIQQVPQKISQTEQKLQQEIRQITYDYVEPQTKSTASIPDGQSTIVMATYFDLDESTKARFCSTVNFHITPTTTGGTATLTVLYGVDGDQQTALQQTYTEGDHILTLDFLTGNLSAGSHVFGVAFGMVGGQLS